MDSLCLVRSLVKGIHWTSKVEKGKLVCNGFCPLILNIELTSGALHPLVARYARDKILSKTLFLVSVFFGSEKKWASKPFFFFFGFSRGKFVYHMYVFGFFHFFLARIFFFTGRFF